MKQPRLIIRNPPEKCVCGEVMSKVSSEDEEIWYCRKCDNEYRINQDGSRDVIS